MGILLKYGGAEGDRTPDLVIANDALSQLSYCPRQERLFAHGCGFVKPCQGELMSRFEISR